jgi:hypothetical protein
MNAASIGFRAKTGRAIVVAIAGDSLLFRREISLVHPDVAQTAEPYHEVMELPWPQWAPTVQPFVAAIESVATSALEALVQEIAARGHKVRGVGIVGSPDSDLLRLGNLHIRAHAAEGMLFRRVLEAAATEHRLKFKTFSDRTIGDNFKPLASTLKALGAQAGAPWRTDEKCAATAAWLAVTSGAPGGPAGRTAGGSPAGAKRR